MNNNPETILEKRVQKTLAYLNSDRGCKNWQLNIERGYSWEMNLIAAIQTATYLIVHEKIVEVYDVVRSQAPAVYSRMEPRKKAA